MVLVAVPLQADLYIEVDDPEDPMVVAMIAAIQERAEISVTGVTVRLDGLAQRIWELMTDGKEARFVVRTGSSRSNAVVLSSGKPTADKAALAGMVSRRASDGHVLFTQFDDKSDLVDFFLALGVEKPGTAASGLAQMKSSVSGDLQAFGLEEGTKLWTKGGAFDLTVFVQLAESDGSGAFWLACEDARNVGPLKIRLMQQLAVLLREQRVV